MRIVELPLPLSPAGRLSLALLVEREKRMNTAWELHIGNNFDLTGPTEATSFTELATGNRFAQVGTLTSGYAADTETIDDVIGLTVQLTGPDIILEEQSVFAGMSNELLVFVGDEIMSVIGYELVGAGLYRLFVIRAQLTSEREEHAFGSTAYLIPKRDLIPLTHEQVQVSNELSFKVVIRTNRDGQELSEVDAVTHTVTGVMLFHLAPSNLTVNGQNRCAAYTAGADIRLDWSLPEARAEVAAVNGVKFRSLVEIVSMVTDDVLYRKLTPAATFKIPAARMATILGAETDFIARISTDGRGRDFQFNTSTIQLLVEQL